MQTTTETVLVLAIVPGQGAQEVEVARGTTVAQLAGQLGIQGAERIAALDGMSEALGPNSEITETTEVVNFVYKLAGA
jgi:sulfur carrier protein ThiS